MWDGSIYLLTTSTWHTSCMSSKKCKILEKGETEYGMNYKVKDKSYESKRKGEGGKNFLWQSLILGGAVP